MLHNVFSLTTWNTKRQTKQFVECPQQILTTYVHISWRAFQLLWLLFETFKIFWFIWQIFLITFKFSFESSTTFLQEKCKWNSLIRISVMTIILFKLNFFLIRVLKCNKKKLPLTSFYCLGQETRLWLDDSWKVISINQSRFCNFFQVGKFKNV